MKRLKGMLNTKYNYNKIWTLLLKKKLIKRNNYEIRSNNKKEEIDNTCNNKNLDGNCLRHSFINKLNFKDS
jgi:hypothetical protein